MRKHQLEKKKKKKKSWSIIFHHTLTTNPLQMLRKRLLVGNNIFSYFSSFHQVWGTEVRCRRGNRYYSRLQKNKIREYITALDNFCTLRLKEDEIDWVLINLLINTIDNVILLCQFYIFIDVWDTILEICSGKRKQVNKTCFFSVIRKFLFRISY